MTPVSKSTRIRESGRSRRWWIIVGFSIIMGIIGGLFAILLRFLIEIVTWFFKDFLLSFITLEIYGLNIGVLLLPTVGGLIVGIIITNFAQETKGSGIPFLLETMTFKGAQIAPKTGIFKTIVSAITIGSGGNAGKEGPIAMISASFGSFFGEKLNLKTEDKRLLMTCGLAAGIAGSFNSPIGGALFGLEILYQSITIFASFPVFLAAVIGVIIVGNVYGFDPIFSVDIDIAEIQPMEYIFFIIAGIIFGLIAYYRFVLYRFIERRFRKLHIPTYFKPAIGGLMVGITFMLLPDMGLYGSGFEGVQKALDLRFGLWMLLLLGILKSINTAATIGSGGSGGVFSPLLYIGCMFGGSLGLIFGLIAPNHVSNPVLYCIIGAAAVFSASAQAPLNICLMLAEMTQHFDVFPPLVITSITSFLVARVFFKGSSIYTLILGEKGFDLKSDTIYLLGKSRVSEIMSSNLITVSPDLPILEFAKVSFQNNNLNQFPVMDFGKLEGLALIDSLYQIPYESWDQVTVKEIMIKENISISPKASLQEAMDVMHEFHRTSLLVTESVEISETEQEQILRGLLTLNDIIRAWQESRLA